MQRSTPGAKCHNKLPLHDRIRALKAYKKTGSYEKVAIQFRCSAHQIRHIVKVEKQQILSEYVNSENYKAAKRAQSEKAVKSQVAILLEKALYEWFQRAQMNPTTGPITNEMLLQKAEDARKVLCMNDFDIDLSWLLKFRQKYDISELDMSMLRIGTDDKPPILDLNKIVLEIVDKNPISPLTEQSTVESLSDLECDDFEFNTSRQKFQIPEQNCNKFDVLELKMSPIANDEEARRRLKPLEDYVLMKENFRAIGIIEQLEEIFTLSKKY